jgi:uncharacterized protein (TIGR02145 family)
LDTYGFSALPGGFRYSGGSFLDAGYHGFWWGTSESYASMAYDRSMGANDEKGLLLNDGKSIGLSVRCIKD